MRDISILQAEVEGFTATELIAWAHSTFGPESLVFASSLGAEDQVITHMISEAAADIPVFTLDTGRLFQESYDLIEKTRKRYGLSLEIYFPNAERVEEMVGEHGPNLFYDSVEKRKLCCHIRKVEPLRRALNGKEAWITGLRQAQSTTRTRLNRVEWDESNGLVKIAPLASWSEEEVWRFIRENDIPYNALHDRGYPSIGCAPCTRAVEKGGEIRSGRWWWEQTDHKECGLHGADSKAEPRIRFASVAPGSHSRRL